MKLKIRPQQNIINIVQHTRYCFLAHTFGHAKNAGRGKAIFCLYNKLHPNSSILKNEKRSIVTPQNLIYTPGRAGESIAT